jgi:hypothetical protein
MDPTGLTWGLVVPDTLRRRVIAKTLGGSRAKAPHVNLRWGVSP